jgi:uncharacterized protein YbcV (DUF1398 family)
VMTTPHTKIVMNNLARCVDNVKERDKATALSAATTDRQNSESSFSRFMKKLRKKN